MWQLYSPDKFLLPVCLAQRWDGLKGQVLGLGLEGQVLKNCPVIGLRTALFFEPLKFCGKTPETSRKICAEFFLFFLKWR